MLIAILLSSIMLSFCFFLISRRSKYASYFCLRAQGNIKEKIVKLEILPLKKLVGINEHKIFSKVLNEVRIFNGMHIIMPCKNGVAVAYANCFGTLMLNSRWINKDGDGFSRLLYLYAASNLYALSDDELVKKQLLKNCIYVFGQKDIIKKYTKNKFKIKHIKVLLFDKIQPIFKFLNSAGISKFAMPKMDFQIFAAGEKCHFNRKCSVSYLIYKSKNENSARVLIKTYVDKTLPVQCFELNANVRDCKFVWFVGADKMKYTLSHTADAFFATDGNTAVGIYAPDCAGFGSSICEKTDELRIYVNSGGDGKIFVIQGKNKNEIIAVVSRIKQRKGMLENLCTSKEMHIITETEKHFEEAYKSRFVVGDELKEKFTAAVKYVPTLFLPTLVYRIENADDFFAVTDKFVFFEKIAATGFNINIVLLYSALNDNVRELINAYTNKEDAKKLISAGVFLFFINKIAAASEAVNYFYKMAEASDSKIKTAGAGQIVGQIVDDAFCNNANIEVNRHISNSFPVTQSVFIRNTTGKAQNTAVNIPLEIGSKLDGMTFGLPSVVVRKSGGIQVTSLKTGRNCNYKFYGFGTDNKSGEFKFSADSTGQRNCHKMPVGMKLITDAGKIIEQNEAACDMLVVRVDVKLAPFEEKVLKIIKNDEELGRKEKKQAFIGSLTDMRVNADNPKLSRLFNLPIEAGGDDTLLGMAKNAIKNFDKDLFFALLDKKTVLSASIYTLLVERVIGLKLIRGKVQLLPNIHISGNFNLEFNYLNKPYKFTVKEKSGGFSVNYNETEYKNFLQIAVE